MDSEVVVRLSSRGGGLHPPGQIVFMGMADAIRRHAEP